MYVCMYVCMCVCAVCVIISTDTRLNYVRTFGIKHLLIFKAKSQLTQRNTVSGDLPCAGKSSTVSVSFRFARPTRTLRKQTSDLGQYESQALQHPGHPCAKGQLVGSASPRNRYHRSWAIRCEKFLC